MPQQINLCSPILRTPKQQYSARSLVYILAGLLLVGGGGSSVWVQHMRQASADYQRLSDSQAREIEALRAALLRAKASAAPVDPALLHELQARNTSVAQRETLYQALQEGLFQPGWGHSDRLSWLARSIPATVWIEAVEMDAQRLDVRGHTLEPAAVTAWVRTLASKPLLAQLKLASVTVRNNAEAPPANAVAGAAAAAAATTPQRPSWSFHLLSAAPNTAATTAPAAAPATKGAP